MLVSKTGSWFPWAFPNARKTFEVYAAPPGTVRQARDSVAVENDTVVVHDANEKDSIVAFCSGAPRRLNPVEGAPSPEEAPPMIKMRELDPSQPDDAILKIASVSREAMMTTAANEQYPNYWKFDMHPVTHRPIIRITLDITESAELHEFTARNKVGFWDTSQPFNYKQIELVSDDLPCVTFDIDVFGELFTLPIERWIGLITQYVTEQDGSRRPVIEVRGLVGNNARVNKLESVEITKFGKYFGSVPEKVEQGGVTLDPNAYFIPADVVSFNEYGSAHRTEFVSQGSWRVNDGVKHDGHMTNYYIINGDHTDASSDNIVCYVHDGMRYQEQAHKLKKVDLDTTPLDNPSRNNNKAHGGGMAFSSFSGFASGMPAQQQQPQFQAPQPQQPQWSQSSQEMPQQQQKSFMPQQHMSFASTSTNPNAMYRPGQMNQVHQMQQQQQSTGFGTPGASTSAAGSSVMDMASTSTAGPSTKPAPGPDPRDQFKPVPNPFLNTKLSLEAAPPGANGIRISAKTGSIMRR